MSYDLDKFAELIAFKLAMEEEPVILWPLCGYDKGWCMSYEGCILKQSFRLKLNNSSVKCKYRTMAHPEYEIGFNHE